MSGFLEIYCLICVSSNWKLDTKLVITLLICSSSFVASSCFVSRITLYTRSLVASTVPFRSTISPRRYGSTVLVYSCWDNTLFVYSSPLSAFIWAIRTFSPMNTTIIPANNTTSFFCIVRVNFLSFFLLFATKFTCFYFFNMFLIVFSSSGSSSYCFT